ncbi:MAG: AMP-dependent synthetase and ligase [Pseudonocardiales bacterium]|nr:AMP-dependent synthetase and ligase [Pseudonocardiales bacterium]
MTVEQLWTGVVSERGGAVAVCECDKPAAHLTYEQVDVLSNLLAADVRAAMVDRRVDAQAPIAILIGHDFRCAVALLALLKVGPPKLFLDPGVPLDRLQGILKSSGADIIVTSVEHVELARRFEAQVVLMAEPAVLETMDAAAVPSCDWAAYDPEGIQGITYTSGSTGEPKGVAVRNSSIVAEIVHRIESDWTRPSDHVGMVMPLSFGAATGELTSSLMLGATLHFFDPRDRGASPMPAWLGDNSISVLAAPPSLLTAVVKTMSSDEVLSDSLRMVRSSGEKVLCSEAVAIRSALAPGCRLLNVFGSSEATLISAYEITDATPDIPKPVPAGRPISDREIRFERPDGTAPDPDEVAEVIVISRYLPAGYWRDEIRTRQRYTPLPDGRVALATGDLGVALPGGAFRLAGRMDLSVKIRGNLVEPAEVEGALLGVKDVQDCVVVGRTNEDGRDRLVAYVVPHPSAEVLRSAELRRELRLSLPNYMIPERFVILSELPRNDRGKLDRSMLPEPAGRTVEMVDRSQPEPTEWENQVCQLWTDVLQLDEVRVDDDFFDLGGDSLSAEELMARLGALHGIEADSRVLLEASTVREFAAKVTASSSVSSQRIVPIRATGTRPPLICVAPASRLGITYHFLARRLGDDQPVWALQATGRERGEFGEWSVRRTARGNIAALKTVQPHGPYFLVGHSFGAVLAFEMAQQLRGGGDEVPLLVCLDSFPPHARELPSIFHRRSLRQWRITVTNHLPLMRRKAPEGPQAHDMYVRQSRMVSLLYRGRSYAGRCLVVVAAENSYASARGERWGRYLTGQWRVQETPGAHATILNEPFVAPLAELITQEMDTLR